MTCVDLFCGCRIHYPLPLPYLGKPDPATLQKEIRALRAELSAVASHGVNRSAELEIQRLRTEWEPPSVSGCVKKKKKSSLGLILLLSWCRLALAREEKESMAKVLERMQFGGNSSTLARDDCGVRDAVRTLQEQLVKERAKNHRTVSKRCQEQRLLVEQVHLRHLLLRICPT